MPEMKEPLFEVAQLAHVELFTPKPDDTLWFFLYGTPHVEVAAAAGS